VTEIVDDYDGDTYRAVYTVRFAGVVYLLHAFQKKSKKGRAMPKRDADLIASRFKIALPADIRLQAGIQLKSKLMTDARVTRSSGNVFADLGLPDAEELLLKAQVATLIGNRIERLGLSQADAAVRIGTTQPNVSNIVTGRLDRFSLEKLLFFVRGLGQDVEIKVRPSKRDMGRLTMAQ
jgi:predicted XRE-type DNA-binding protein